MELAFFYTYILIQPSISLGDRLPPYDFASGKAHDDVDVRGTPGNEVDIMA